MVSTRQSSNVGGNENSGNADQSPSRILRHAVGHISTIDSHLSPPTTNEATLNKPLNLLDLPVEILETIFGFLPHKNVSDLRLVCRKVDTVCGNILNTTFQRLQTQMLNRFQSIKAKMPRRESARRTHPLACESDIIETLHMRLTLLQMTFGKHIERRHCCFFAGEILDEVYRVLNYIKITPTPLARPYKVTDELFDLSTMAMEYFKERIEPTLPEIAYFGTDFLDFGTFSSPGPSNNKSYMCLDSPPHKSFDNNSVEDTVDSPPQSNMVLRKRIRKIKQGMKRYNSQLSLMRRDLRNCKSRIAEQQKQILEYASRLDENDKKNEETSRKFSTLLQELNKCKTELQYWRSKSPANPPVCTACGKVLTPVPSEDLQALANQGVMPEGFGFGFDSEGALAGGSSDFLPIASTSNDIDLEQENNAISPMEDPSIVLDLDSSVCRESDNKDTSFPSTSTNKEVLQPLSPQTCRSTKPCSSKRKASDEFYSCHESKKTRRSKRSKV